MIFETKSRLYDHLEDLLVKGFPARNYEVVRLSDIQPLLETARALLMIERGKDPILPKGFVA